MDASPLRPQVSRVIEATGDVRLVQSVVLTRHGRLNRIQIEDTPLPRSLEDDHVEVEVYYCGLNFTDNYLRLGIIRNEAFPIIMGSECCGIVRRVGAGVDDLQVGSRVLCLRMQGGLLRRVVQLPRANCFTLHGGVSLEDAVALGLAGLVSFVCLCELGRLKKGAVVFMQSLAGGVGTMVAQMARQVPYVTVLGTASEEKHDKLWRLGVSRVYRHEDNYVQRILRLYPEGVDLAIVRSGGSETDKFLKLLKPCGRLITIGSDSTATYPRTITRTLQRPTWDTKYVSSAELINKNVIMAGLNIGDMIENHPSDVQAILNGIFNLRFQEKLKPQIHKVEPFYKMTDGLELLCRRENFGKVLLQVRVETGQRMLPFSRQLGSPPRDAQATARWVKHQQRAHMKALYKRKLENLERLTGLQAKPEPEMREQAEHDSDDAAKAGHDEDEGYSMFTEMEASVAKEMVKAISESETSLDASF